VRPRRVWVAWLVAIAVVSLFSSCSSGPRFHPVRGQVFVNGKPAEGVLVVFNPDGPTNSAGQPSGHVRADGSFELRTYVVRDRITKDGALAGAYLVTCVWYPEDLHNYIGKMEQLPDKLNGRYANPKTTSLTAEVAEGPTVLPPFQLEASPK
jgi:hypothetical protein